MRARARRFLPAVAAAAALLAGCVSAPAVTETAATADAPTPPSVAATPQASSSPTTTAATCDDATVSYAPATSSAYAAAIRSRGYLLVGVSADTRLLGAVNPSDPNTFEGFDIDMARLVAEAIFGSATSANLRFKVITTAARIDQLQEPVDTDNNAAGGVDLVARTFTMNCERWNEIAFSAVYLNASQKILVPTDSDIDAIAGLSGKRVCAAEGSTSLTTISRVVADVQAVGLPRHTDCLVALQAGQVDAITGDDAILAGFSDQDPNTTVLPEGDGISPEPYGLGVPAEHPDFAAYVNSVLDDARSDGSWQSSYDRWLRPALGARTPPQPQYGRT